MCAKRLKYGHFARNSKLNSWSTLFIQTAQPQIREEHNILHVIGQRTRGVKLASSELVHSKSLYLQKTSTITYKEEPPGIKFFISQQHRKQNHFAMLH